MNTQLLSLYIVQDGEVVETCNAPWHEPTRKAFYCIYEHMRMDDWRTALVEATSEREAIREYFHVNGELLAMYGETIDDWRVI
jgi:hypothetical protein